jgi:hypothetical protein
MILIDLYDLNWVYQEDNDTQKKATEEKRDVIIVKGVFVSCQL